MRHWTHIVCEQLLSQLHRVRGPSILRRAAEGLDVVPVRVVLGAGLRLVRFAEDPHLLLIRWIEREAVVQEAGVTLLALLQYHLLPGILAAGAGRGGVLAILHG